MLLLSFLLLLGKDIVKPAPEINSANFVRNRICYYVPDKTFVPELIDPTLCTHIIVGFGAVRNGTLQPSQPNDIQVYKQINALKQTSTNLKTLLSIGGGAGAGGFPDTVRNKTTRWSFIKQSMEFIKKNGFDGLDIDWEFPAWNGGPKEDKENFVSFLQEFYYANSVRGDAKLLLTAAVASVLPIIDISYNIPEMAKYVDFVSIMCYDYNFYRNIFPFTGHNSPLYKHHDDIVYLNTLNIQWSVERWEKGGMPKSKIMVGLPTYGHTFKLLDASKNSLNAPAVGPGSGSGWITYPEACKVLQSEYVHVFDNESMVPYAYKDLNWISYDDVQSITLKGEWIVKNGYGGSMTWSLNADDWIASCDGKTKFPLHSALRNSLLT